MKVVTESCYSMTRTKSSLMIIILWRPFLSLFHIFFYHKYGKSHHKFEVYSDDLDSSLSVLVFSDKNSHHLVNFHVNDNLWRLLLSFTLKSCNWSLQIWHCHGISNNYSRTFNLIIDLVNLHVSDNLTEFCLQELKLTITNIVLPWHFQQL